MGASSAPTTGTISIIPLDTEAVDSLGEWSTSTYVFSAKDTGYFFVTSKVSYRTLTIAGTEAITMTLCGSSGTYKTKSYTVQSSGYTTLDINTVAFVVSGGTLAAFITPPADIQTILSAGTGNSYIRIHRIS
jgi:hypothetical protein